MKCIALYSVKGGVGKTTLATNLAWASAALSSRATLLWDLDPQAGASFLLGYDQPNVGEAQAVFEREISPLELAQPTAIDRLSLLPADHSLRDLNLYFHELGKKGRLAKLLKEVGKHFDRVVLDCPPGLTETTTQVLRAADLVVVPLVPSPLSLRALDALIETLDSRSIPRKLVLPVLNMVDRRRAVHLETLDAYSDWPAVPMSSAIEALSTRRRPLGSLPRGSAPAKAIAELWRRIEWRLARS
jgi:cellulose biosynthesis protein BcsQ